MIDALKSVRDISRICEEEMRDSNHMRDITHLYPNKVPGIKLLALNNYFIRLVSSALTRL